MITLVDLTNQLNDYLQISLFQDFCVNGIQVEGKKEIRKVATAVTASLNIIEKAALENVDALIVHHGLFWNKDSHVIKGVKKEKIALLLRHGISLLAYHLPLDAHQEIGNNWKAAKDLGWIDLEGFHQEQTKCIGVKGRFPKMSRDAFQSQLEKYYGQKAALAFGGKEIVSSSALISGGAYRIMEEAADEGLDCYITGNFDEPAWHLAHEGKINFFALGHAATEQVGPKALADYIQHQMGIKATFIIEPNPF